ncbi:MAG: hypothetical protein ACTSR3_04900 [Candidatus Helarchaeota archaeon]
MNITIKGVKENLYRLFKAEAVKKGKSLKEAINEALEIWINQDKLKITKNRSVMREAIIHMDANRKKVGGIDTVAIIRKWRDNR